MRSTLAAVVTGFVLGLSAPLALVVYHNDQTRHDQVNQAICSLDDALVRVLDRAATGIPPQHTQKYDAARRQVAIDVQDIRSTAVCPVPRPT